MKNMQFNRKNRPSNRKNMPSNRILYTILYKIYKILYKIWYGGPAPPTIYYTFFPQYVPNIRGSYLVSRIAQKAPLPSAPGWLPGWAGCLVASSWLARLASSPPPWLPPGWLPLAGCPCLVAWLPPLAVPIEEGSLPLIGCSCLAAWLLPLAVPIEKAPLPSARFCRYLRYLGYIAIATLRQFGYFL